MTVYGYQRVSTQEQHLDRQTQALIEYGIPAANIYTDKDSGGKVHRKQLDMLLSVVKPGDKVVVLSFDRLARSVKQLLSISEDFQERKIELVSIKEQIDTSTAAGKLFFTITAAFAEFEKNMNNERTKQGLEAAKNNGVKLGRPAANQEKLDEACRLYEAGNMKMAQICQVVGLSEYPIRKEIRKRGLTKRNYEIKAKGNADFFELRGEHLYVNVKRKQVKGDTSRFDDDERASFTTLIASGYDWVK